MGLMCGSVVYSVIMYATVYIEYIINSAQKPQGKLRQITVELNNLFFFF